MDLENHTISSPYYPKNYFDDGDDCNWLITAPKGHIISLEFEHFNVRKKSEVLKYIIIYFFNISYSSYITKVLLHFLMECVIKQKKYKH